MKSFFVERHEPTLKASFIRRSDSVADNPTVQASRPPNHGSRHLRLRIALASALLIGLAPPSAWGSDSRDHERARAAVEAGQVLPLPTLLERLRRTHPGEVLELELEREEGRWVYEVKLLQPHGQLLKLEVDAATAQVLKVKRKTSGKDGRHAERDAGRQAAPSEGPPK